MNMEYIKLFIELPIFFKFKTITVFTKLASHKIKSLSNVSSEYLSWLSGFSDGEASFSIISHKKKKLLNFHLELDYI